MNAITINNEVYNRSKAFDYSGYDPFDGLNSILFEAFPSLKKGLFGLAWIQLNKLSPVNLRPLLMIPRSRNPKGIGLFILGLLEDFRRTGDAEFLNEASQLGDWLLEHRSDQSLWKYACWGYHFDWNARAFFVPKGKPNIITTVYVAQALYALGMIKGEQAYIDKAFEAASFIVETLYTEADGRKFFAYIPGEKAFVHNASLWGAAWVGFVGSQKGDYKFTQIALLVARQSVSEQRENGSWVYGARHHHQFIDGFHTGYNLEALQVIRDALATSEFDEAIERGLSYYKDKLIEDDGTAKYYDNSPYPLDMHSVTQVVITLLKVSGKTEDQELARRVINKSISTLYMPNKHRFMYQKHKRFSNKVDYMRWTQAWVYYSFAYFNRTVAERNETN